MPLKNMDMVNRRSSRGSSPEEAAKPNRALRKGWCVELFRPTCSDGINRVITYAQRQMEGPTTDSALGEEEIYLTECSLALIMSSRFFEIGSIQPFVKFRPSSHFRLLILAPL